MQNLLKKSLRFLELDSRFSILSLFFVAALFLNPTSGNRFLRGPYLKLYNGTGGADFYVYIENTNDTHVVYGTENTFDSSSWKLSTIARPSVSQYPYQPV
jgi:hypothetical protein